MRPCDADLQVAECRLGPQGPRLSPERSVMVFRLSATAGAASRDTPFGTYPAGSINGLKLDLSLGRASADAILFTLLIRQCVSISFRVMI